MARKDGQRTGFAARRMPSADVDHLLRPTTTTYYDSDDHDACGDRDAVIASHDETTLFLLQKSSRFIPSPLSDNNNNSLEMETLTLNMNNRPPLQQASSSWVAVTMNLAKCICGAGSFALPHVFLEQGIVGGLISMTVCAILAIVTMEQLMQCLCRIRSTTTQRTGDDGLSYVQLTRIVFQSRMAARGVFALTLAASWGVCSTYVVFIGQTLESLATSSTTALIKDNNEEIDSGDDMLTMMPTYNSTTTTNYVQPYFPNVSCTIWEIAIVLFILYPLSCISDYTIFAFTSTLGVLSVLGGIVVTCVYGLWVDPGWEHFGLQNLPWWPESSWTTAFGSSFGTIAYLFGIHFLTFPIMNSTQQQPEHYGRAVRHAVWGVWLVNVVFAVLCVGFYGDNTQDLVLANLNNNSPYLAALKLLLCIDLIFTFPIVFSSGRQIVEHAWLAVRASAAPGKHDDDDNNYNNCPESLKISRTERAVLVAVAVMLCLGLAQIGGFGAVANLVGGVAQGTLAFVLPPAIMLQLARTRMLPYQILTQWLIGAFGAMAVMAVTYTTVSGMLKH